MPGLSRVVCLVSIVRSYGQAPSLELAQELTREIGKSHKTSKGMRRGTWTSNSQ